MMFTEGSLEAGQASEWTTSVKSLTREKKLDLLRRNSCTPWARKKLKLGG